MYVSLPTGSGKSSCYYLLSRAFDFLRQRTALRQSIASSRLYHGPHNFEPRRNTSGNLSALQKTSAATYFKRQKKLEERNTFLRSDDRKKTLQSEQLTKYIISRRHSTLSFYSGDNEEIIIMTVPSTHKTYSNTPDVFSPSSLFGERNNCTCARKIHLARETSSAGCTVSCTERRSAAWVVDESQSQE